MVTKPKNIKFKKTKPTDINLIIHGQGIYIFEVNDNLNTCIFNLYNKDKTDGLKIEFTTEKVNVNYIASEEPLIDIKNTSGLLHKNGVYYWFSLDAQNQILLAGIGEARFENIIYNYSCSHLEKTFFESLTMIETNTTSPLQLLRDPVTSNIPLVIMNTNDLSMNDIAEGAYLPHTYLSPTSRKLYDCISGNNFNLNDDDFPEFSDAIEYSIKTPGCWCFEKLKSKSTEFNPDKPNILETYLRITLTQNSGESPGIPYVMEIWPIGHFSPVHNHGGSSAIIRVLHGNINVKLFPFLCNDAEGVDVMDIANFVKDDITWISPTLNQVHQLTNLSNNTETCITIQCYMYESDDTIHYDYFDYIDADGNKQQYEPDSDMDFIDFKKLMKTEWDNRPKDNYSFSEYIYRQIFGIKR